MGLPLRHYWEGTTYFWRVAHVENIIVNFSINQLWPPPSKPFSCRISKFLILKQKRQKNVKRFLCMDICKKKYGGGENERVVILSSCPYLLWSFLQSFLFRYSGRDRAWKISSWKWEIATNYEQIKVRPYTGKKKCHSNCALKCILPSFESFKTAEIVHCNFFRSYSDL